MLSLCMKCMMMTARRVLRLYPSKCPDFRMRSLARSGFLPYRAFTWVGTFSLLFLCDHSIAQRSPKKRGEESLVGWWWSSWSLTSVCIFVGDFVWGSSLVSCVFIRVIICTTTTKLFGNCLWSFSLESFKLSGNYIYIRGGNCEAHGSQSFKVCRYYSTR